MRKPDVLVSQHKGKQQVMRLSILASAMLACVGNSYASADLSYLQSKLDAAPAGSWVKVSTGLFSDSWTTPSTIGGLPSGTYSNPGSIVNAWSSVAWDSNRGQLMLWGGGHANYMGNEMYLWQASTGTWTRGSLPSKLERYGSTATYFTADNAAPQSAHVYDNSLYLPVNDRFITFGGAAFNSGGVFQVKGPDGKPTVAGPWLYDPSKADANKVGGTTGSGYAPSILGGNMWSNERGRWTGVGPIGGFVETSTAYRTEGGKDVAYVTSDVNASGWQQLYRYELGNVAAGEIGKFDLVGTSSKAPSYQSASTFDTENNLYIKTSVLSSYWNTFKGLGVWDLSAMSATDPTPVGDVYVNLKKSDGTDFDVTTQHGIAYSSELDKIFLWDGLGDGAVWVTQATYDENGKLQTTWLIEKLAATTADHPEANFRAGGYDTGVLGKWQYIEELNAFIALDSFNEGTQDAAVWLYKPSVTAVPEPATYALLLSGVGGLLAWRRRRTYK